MAQGVPNAKKFPQVRPNQGLVSVRQKRTFSAPLINELIALSAIFWSLLKMSDLEFLYNFRNEC